LGLTKIVNATYAAKKGFFPTSAVALEANCGSYFDIVRSYSGKILFNPLTRHESAMQSNLTMRCVVMLETSINVTLLTRNYWKLAI